MIWPFIDGHFMGKGIDLEAMPGPRMVHVLMNFFVEDAMFEKEHLEARDRARAHMLRDMSSENPGYDRYEQQGRSNDDFGAPSGEPLPYIEPTPQTEDGYVGLLPPMA
jgi:hypothetical protein